MMRRLALGIFGLLAASIFTSTSAHAAGFYGGIGLYAQNSFNKTTKSDDGSTSLLGSYSYPLVLRYDYDLSSPWSVSPSLHYTLLPRSSGGSTSQTTFIHLSIPATYSFSGAGKDWELSAGLGLSMYSVKGAGGTKVLNNGTTTSTFAVPGGTSTAKLVTFDVGFAWVDDPHRLGLELFNEGFGSEEKRTFNLLVSYMYKFGGN